MRKFGPFATYSKSIYVIKHGGFGYLQSPRNVNRVNDKSHRNKKKFLFVSNSLLSPSHVYRVENIADALKYFEIDSEIVSHQSFKASEFEDENLVGSLFWRTEINEQNKRWLTWCNQVDIPCGYDTDDVTFNKKIFNLENIPALLEMPKQEQWYQAQVLPELQIKQILGMNYFSGPTQGVIKGLTNFDKLTILIPNVIPRWMENQGKTSRQVRRPTLRNGLSYVYASGSRTHQRDFLEASDEIFRFLQRHPTCTLTILGSSPLHREDIPHNLFKQILFQKTVNHFQLIPKLSEFDVQIIPLELSNPFVQAKSSLKFLQGSAARLLTIASASQPMIQDVKPGTTGLLVSDKGQWAEALEMSLDSKLRHEIISNSFEDTMENHTIEKLVPIIEEILSFRK
jgi:hypothetical protein